MMGTTKISYVCYTVLITLGLWWLLPFDLEIERKVPALFATISMVSMSLAIVISCRPKLLDKVLGGIDRAYVWHKWLGIFGLLGALFHWLLVPGPAGNSTNIVFTEFGEEVGQWAVYGLLVIGGASLIRVLPYRIWFYTHKLMAPIFLISVYHTFFSDVPFELFSHTGFALVLVSLIGVVGVVYRVFLMTHSYKEYRVESVHRLGDAILLKLSPIMKGIEYSEGQFAYLDFRFDTVENFHPYTIVSNPNQHHLSFIIRSLGKHTSELQDKVLIGQVVTVDGGYGQLTAKRDVHKPQVWIAGGIGITPFIAWLSSLIISRTEVHLFYVGRGEFYCRVVNAVAKITRKKGVYFHTNLEKGERLTSEFICSKLSMPIKHYQVFCCGPVEMLKDLRRQLKRSGMSDRQWHNENFVMR